MMRGALLVLGLLGTVVLIAAGALGYGLGGATEEQVRSHVLLSLAATLVLIFSHTWIVLYLLATGRVISQTAAARDPGGAADATGELLERARRLRLRALPWLLAAIVALAAAFLTGSAAASGSIPAPVHQALFYVTLAAQVAAMLVERRVLADHDRVGDEIGRRMQADAA